MSLRKEMTRFEVTAELNLQNLIKESREVAQALSEFADNLERIEKKYDEENYEMVNLGNGLYERRRKQEREEEK